MISEVLDLQDEEKNNIDKLDNKEKILDSSYISKEQLSLLLNKINICKLNEVKEIEKEIGSIESRRKNKITKITNNDINKIQEYKSNEGDDLIKKLEQKRAIVSELKKTNLDLEANYINRIISLNNLNENRNV